MRAFQSICLMLGYGMPDTIMMPAKLQTVNASARPGKPGLCHSLANQTKAATRPAAEGLGRPSKYRLSTVAARALKRARRSAAQAT